MTEHYPDDDLGPELRDLPVPEHKPGFWERLDRRLEAEESVIDRRTTKGSGDGVRLSAWARYAPLVIAALVVLLIIVLVVV